MTGQSLRLGSSGASTEYRLVFRLFLYEQKEPYFQELLEVSALIISDLHNKYTAFPSALHGFIDKPVNKGHVPDSLV